LARVSEPFICQQPEAVHLLGEAPGATQRYRCTAALHGLFKDICAVMASQREL